MRCQPSFWKFPRYSFFQLTTTLYGRYYRCPSFCRAGIRAQAGATPAAVSMALLISTLTHSPRDKITGSSRPEVKVILWKLLELWSQDTKAQGGLLREHAVRRVPVCHVTFPHSRLPKGMEVVHSNCIAHPPHRLRLPWHAPSRMNAFEQCCLYFNFSLSLLAHLPASLCLPIYPVCVPSTSHVSTTGTTGHQGSSHSVQIPHVQRDGSPQMCPSPASKEPASWSPQEDQNEPKI